MKKQSQFLQGHCIALIFPLLLVFAGCGQTTTIKEKTTAPKTDIHTAVVTGDAAVLKQHIAARSDLNTKDPIGGSSPLITACLFGKTELAKILIDAGADINFKNNDGSTPLHTAAFFCRPEIVQMLLAARADKTIKNKYGQTPAEIVSTPFAAVKSIYENMEKMLAPMGLKLDYTYIGKTRPQIAAMLNKP
ncbi:ankyrin repeat domain-containing protein [Sediminibacterium ginsengisoli]|uniref:Ankyrin repeat-containing protein n=1 Tax=Sediminibacterium ginsengisoli TaxID=413434 RepID=A0A1T4N7C1_9BACT|nr:ankyrin repeat domain-containing protein [Sediminibacterium ginsengisoli]SJZ75081.1 Ankyrin repeat-containing protein [Sediminibacterium ginsengisoli]